MRSFFEELKIKIEKNIGDIKIRPRNCCIHFMAKSAFMAVFIRKDKMRTHIMLDHEIKSSRISNFHKLSEKKYKYVVYLNDKKDIDKEFLGWVKKAYELSL